MWRHPRQTSIVCRAVRNIKIVKRSFAEEAIPQPPPIKKTGGIFFKLLGLTAIGTGGVVGYAWYDDSFRRLVEENLPYSKEALTYIFNALPLDSPSIGTEENPLDMPSFPTKVHVVPSEKKEPKSDALPSTKTVQPPLTADKKRELSVTPPALPSKQDFDRQFEAQAAAAEADNAVLERTAEELLSSCEETAKTATQRHFQAVEAIKMHKEQIKKAMKSGSSEGEEWDSVSRALDQKRKLVEEAERSAAEARSVLGKLKHILTDGRENANTKGNPLLIGAQIKLNQLNYTLESAYTERQAVESSLTMLSEFRDLIDRGRKQFQKELSSIVPDASVGKKGKHLTVDELNALIAHAHRRIEQLQIRLAEQEALEQERLDQALAKQSLDDEHLTDNVVRCELDRQRGEEALQRQRWEADVVAEMEERLREELSRQAAAHNDHLADVLRVQRRELGLQYKEDLREVVLQERVEFNNDISDSVARLKGIETAVEARAQMERTGRKAQELWLACQTLVRSLNGDETTHQTALDGDIRAVKEAGNGHVFVDTLVASIPEEALHLGVQTEATLVERFRKVKKVCRRVSLIDETGGSLLKYVISYLQSLLVLERGRGVRLEDQVEPEELDTFTILTEAERYMNEGDLEQAVRFVRQLSGQAGGVAKDWLRDAMLLLETRQAANALLGHASACGLGSLCSAFAEEEKHCCH